MMGNTQQKLQDMGFDESACVIAAKKHPENVSNAVNFILNNYKEVQSSSNQSRSMNSRAMEPDTGERHIHRKAHISAVDPINNSQNKSSPLTRCTKEHIISMIRYHSSFNDETINKWKPQIIEYIDDNKIDGDALSKLIRKDFGQNLVNYASNKKIRGAAIKTHDILVKNSKGIFKDKDSKKMDVQLLKKKCDEAENSKNNAIKSSQKRPHIHPKYKSIDRELFGCAGDCGNYIAKFINLCIKDKVK